MKQWKIKKHISLLYRESCYGAKYIFIVEHVCRNLFRWDVSNIIKFKCGDTEIQKIAYKELFMSEFLIFFLIEGSFQIFSWNSYDTNSRCSPIG
jgi:hypothetical protein